MVIDCITNSLEQTFTAGREIAKDLRAGDVVAFIGDLGAGKTTLIKGILSDAADVTSPTFTYLNVYLQTPMIYHFDLYRIDSAQKFIAMGFEEYFEEGGICLIEWAENIWDLLPAKASFIKITHLDESSRKIIYEKN